MINQFGDIGAKLFDRFLELTGLISGIICAGIMFSLCYEVIARKLFRHPTIWALDVSSLGLLFATLIAAAWVLKHEGHVKVDVLLLRLNPRIQAVVNCFTSLVCLLACLVFLWQGAEATYTAYKEEELLYRSLVVPRFLYLWAFPLCFLLLCIQFARRFISYIRDIIRDRIENGQKASSI